MFLLNTVVLATVKVAMDCCWIDEDGEMDNEELDEQDEELETDEWAWGWSVAMLKGDWALVDAIEPEHLLS